MVELITAIVNNVTQSYPDTTYNIFDSAGNVRFGGQKQWRPAGSTYERSYSSATASYYGADQKLRVFQKYGDPMDPNRAGVYEEYLYDALGRRVLVRTRADSLCWNGCHNALELYIWDGGQIIAETREQAGGNAPSGQYGAVAYTHGPIIDRPLSVLRQGYDGSPLTIIPHSNWRGLFDSGTKSDGALIGDCSGGAPCADIIWPGTHRRAYYNGLPRSLPNWFGSLIQDKQDMSGLLYMRNRYYNPQTGQFTQEDPIGLAGGLNLYGYANGDPVNFSDPFGLSAVSCCTMRLALAGARGGASLGSLVLPGWGTVAGAAIGGVLGVAGGLVLGKVLSEAVDGSEGSPEIHPGEVAGKTPSEIDALAKEKGLTPKGPNPAQGQGSYVDPVTGQQRILSHPNACPPHCHVNNPAGQRLDINGNVVAPESPAAHLPIKKDKQ